MLLAKLPAMLCPLCHSPINNLMSIQLPHEINLFLNRCGFNGGYFIHILYVVLQLFTNVDNLLNKEVTEQICKHLWRVILW